jgi:pyruvate/2-oxoglutarate/acetoin dehydrogenase E1 component
MRGVHDALEAADRLDADLEVIDVRTIRPLDIETIAKSVAKTNRLMVVEEGPSTGGWSNGVLAQIAEHAIEDLDDAWRLTTGDAPIPYSPSLEDAFLPGAEAIAASITERIR